jgi:Tol biopolymer transport system component
VLPNLEEFTVRSGGSVVDSIDRNYWGVTFIPGSDEFYATLQTGGRIYLIKGDVSSRTGDVVGTDIECPSLSPDGTRIAFKERDGGAAVTWHLGVLDLDSGGRWRLGETRSVDDQVEWADDDTVIYGLPTSTAGSAETDVWAVPADGSGHPSRWIARAWSPGVVSS